MLCSALCGVTTGQTFNYTQVDKTPLAIAVVEDEGLGGDRKAINLG